MKTKVLALLWEETRVGGAIAGAALMGGLLALVGLSTTPTVHMGGGAKSDPFLLIATLAFPLMAILLVTLNTANSGHLIGGFSRRILRLPVETWSAVLVILLTRLVAVLLVTAVMAATSWGLFGRGPGADTVLLLGMAYLVVQVLDWMRDAAQHVVTAIIVLVGTFLLLNVHQLPELFSPARTVIWNPAALALMFVPAVAVAYGLSLASVHYARKGAKLNLLAVLPTLEFPGVRGSAASRPFSSPLAAQVWYEARRAGLFLPLMTVLLWIGFVGFHWLVLQDSGAFDSQNARTFIYEFYPVLAFLLAAGAWNLRMNRTGSWRKNRPGSYALRLPVETVDLARARTISAALHFAAVLAVVAVISRLAYLCVDHGIILWFLHGAYTNGELSVREIVILMLGMPILLGVVAWSLMHLPLRFMAIEALAGLVMAFLLTIHAEDVFVSLVACFMLFLPLGWFLRSCMVAVRRSVLPLRTLVACLLAWAAIGLAIFPYGNASVGDHPLLSIAACAAIAVLPVFPFVRSLTRLPGHRSAWDAPRRAASMQRMAAFGLLAASLLAVALLKATTEPLYKAKMHAEGLPATFDEMKALYPLVPANENLAERYLAASVELDALANRWMKGDVPEEKVPQLNTGLITKEYPHGVLVAGDAELGNTEQIPDEVWRTTLDYWNRVGEPVTARLHEAAQSGLVKSRYPYNIDDAIYSRLEHLGPVRDLSAHLSLKALVAIVQGNPEEIATALRDLGSLAESLKDEPFIASQFTRFGIHQEAPSALQSALSRRVFTDPELAEFSSILEQNLPALAERPLMNNALLGEMLVYNEWSEGILRLERRRARAMEEPLSLPKSSAVISSVMTPVLDGFGWNALERVVGIRTYFVNMENYVEERQRGYAGRHEDDGNIWTSHLFAHAPIGSIRGPSLWRTTTEWHLVARFGTARTALAVERYRLANEHLPNSLEELVPQYLDRVPLDPFRKDEPLSYRAGENGGYTVYSYGSNWKDDGGESVKCGQDIAFEVPPLELRMRPQVQ